MIKVTDRELLNIAEDAAEMSYVPYSKFPVGAALECGDGTIYTGCAIENAAMSLMVCAEQAAAVKAVTDGQREFIRLAVYAKSESYYMPCGCCRQFLMEFDENLEFLCAKSGGRYVSYKLSELLSRAFRGIEK
jgi:cytidine deaminase, homotetrameric